MLSSHLVRPVGRTEGEETLSALVRGALLTRRLAPPLVAINRGIHSEGPLFVIRGVLRRLADAPQKSGC